MLHIGCQVWAHQCSSEPGINLLSCYSLDNTTRITQSYMNGSVMNVLWWTVPCTRYNHFDSERYIRVDKHCPQLVSSCAACCHSAVPKITQATNKQKNIFSHWLFKDRSLNRLTRHRPWGPRSKGTSVRSQSLTLKCNLR